ncbi:PQQ-binding-like beta-propeller repeat protein [Actinoplanes sp. NPDC049548]|uniref:outer membrane protein assembly factor BamB family protein n=1 Tax=Actinoplanes sp. NPDC049548 TaxID=3155152 RepID=UPI003435A445
MTYRRLWSVALVTVIGTALGFTAVPSAAAAANGDAWGQAASHATGDYYNPGEKKLTPAVAPKAKKRWSVPLGSAKCTSPSVPLVGANRLVTAAAYRISGYDATTGALRWRTPEAGKRHITLAAIVGTNLVAQYWDCRSGKSYLTAFNVGTGKALYTKQITATMYDLLVDKGILVGGLWDPTIGNYGLRAYRISDGALVWARQGSMAGQAVSAGGRIVAFGNDEPGAAFDITTGKRLWSTGAGCYSPIGASPDGAKFYMSCNDSDGIQVVDAATGQVTASFPYYGTIFGFATDGKRVYLGTLSDSGVLAVDAGTGGKVWSTKFADRGPIMFSTGGGVLYGWRSYGHPIAAFDAKTGQAIKLDAGTSMIQGPPLMANGRLYGPTGSSVITFAP